MAAVLTAGDLVQYNSEIHSHKLGWNMFRICSLDSGEELDVPRHRILPINDTMDSSMDDEVDNDFKTYPSNTAHPEAKEKGKSRWGDLDERERQELDANRHSKSTESQSKWAVKMFKGMVFVVCPAHSFIPRALC